MEYYDSSNDDDNIDDGSDFSENGSNKYQQTKHQKRNFKGKKKQIAGVEPPKKQKKLDKTNTNYIKKK